MSDNMKQKIALFRAIKYGWLSVWINDTDTDDFAMDGYVRISEWQNVEFTQLPAEQAVAAEIAMLQDERAKVSDEFGKKLAYIDGRISNLRSITHSPVEP